MNERQEICVVTTIGAAVGAVVAYLFFTERGSALRNRVLPMLDEFEHDLNHFRSRVVRTAAIASEGWRSLNDAIGEAAGPVPRSNPHQNAPF